MWEVPLRLSLPALIALLCGLSPALELSAQPASAPSRQGAPTAPNQAPTRGPNQDAASDKGQAPSESAQAAADSKLSKSDAIQAQTLWVFEGPLAPRILGFTRDMYANRVAAHIFERQELVEHIKEALMARDEALDAEALSCLTDRSSCDDQALLMRRLALKERIFVSATEDDQGFEVTLERHGQRRGAVKVYKTRDQELSEACATLFEQLLQVGTLTIEGLPSSFSLAVDHEPVSVARWPIVLEAGEHELSLEAPEHEPLQVKVLIKPSLLTELKVKLTSSKVKLKVIVLDDERMPDLKLKLDGEELKPGELVEVRINQDYQVTASADDRSSYNETHRFQQGHDSYTLTIEMPYARPYWKVALKQPHEDRVHNSLAYFRVSGGALSGGSWRARSAEADDQVPDEFKSQGYGVSSWGFDFGLKWDADPSSPTGSLRLDLGGFAYQHISAPLTINEGAPAEQCGGMICQGFELKSLDRYLTRLLWVGYQATLWRVTPYANLGLLWLYERGELAGVEGEVSAHALRLGWEVGVDALLTPEWGLKASLTADAWPGQRGAHQLSLGLTYAFSVPYPF